MAFDLVELDGDDLRREPLAVRKATLASVVAPTTSGVRFNDHLDKEVKRGCYRTAIGIRFTSISRQKGRRYALWKLRHLLDLHRLMPFIVGSALGIPFGLAALRWPSLLHFRVGVGVLLITFSLYNLLRPRPVCANEARYGRGLGGARFPPTGSRDSPAGCAA